MRTGSSLSPPVYDHTAGSRTRRSPSPSLSLLACPTHCPPSIPRDMVSQSEKEQFSGIMARLNVQAAIAAKDGDSSRYVGLSCHWCGDQIGAERALEALGQHLVVGAAEGADFFVLEGLESAADVDAVAGLLADNLPRMVTRGAVIFNSQDRDEVGGWLGKQYEDGEEQTGFELPSLILGDSSAANWGEVCKAAEGHALITGVMAK